MKLKPIHIAPGMAVASLLAPLIVAAEMGPRRQATQAFMRAKLVCSQSVLEGLALEKFDIVTKNAVQLRNMTHSNMWFTVKQVDYMTHTTNYQRSVDKLYMAAVDKNLDSATEAYLNVMRNCVDCHRLVRTAQNKRLTP